MQDLCQISLTLSHRVCQWGHTCFSGVVIAGSWRSRFPHRLDYAVLFGLLSDDEGCSAEACAADEIATIHAPPGTSIRRWGAAGDTHFLHELLTGPN